ncbi:macro domain-containing protein [Micromonospora sagamiensis]|uniref:O-acetyl-ADP-ribose deacetylase (Regulator of RNase III) n=1 Tax=Micromonospora sagamiensis TaxID=47875 RepID=A0A562WL79_9ACTN|nr:macro domain-containing protein [Micromonospora sagamiensis]TWJ31053.1 O-acetyl-ADP-ribose deacetylase (regulator of RNase III) [Micromonospora sagamiensis]BCL15905.1 hypothetical protein GCM10017556_36440 [Micromonospora sagamiensis]
MLTIRQGNLLDSDAEALVNAVNTLGVMGKGIALAFRQAYPENHARYRAACASGNVRLGRVFLYDSGRLGPRRYVINFPTKGHCQTTSRLSDIEAGLHHLARVVRDLEIMSLAIPPLGCGNGGLDWADVRPAIESAFHDLPEVQVYLYPPSGQRKAAGQRRSIRQLWGRGRS